jgi:predicted methyltransferase MtxX (methanogen marker protein 4)
VASANDAAGTTPSMAEAAGLGSVIPFHDAADLVSALTDGEVDAGVRGTLSSRDVLPLLLGVTGARMAGRAALLVPNDGRALLLTPVGIDEGRDLEERWTLLSASAGMARALGVEPEVAVMSMGREEDRDRGEAVSLSIRECEALRSAAEANGIRARCVGIQLEWAIGSADVVVAPDGVTGNLVFRALHLVGGLDSLGALALGLLPLAYVDTSRERSDYLGPVLLARAMANLARGLKP